MSCCSVFPSLSPPRCRRSLSVLDMFPPLLTHLPSPLCRFLFSPHVCVARGTGVCDSGPVKSDLWDAKGGIVPYVSAPPAAAVRSRRSRLLLPPFSSWLRPVSRCGGVCRPSFSSPANCMWGVHLFESQVVVCLGLRVPGCHSPASDWLNRPIQPTSAGMVGEHTGQNGLHSLL